MVYLCRSGGICRKDRIRNYGIRNIMASQEMIMDGIEDHSGHTIGMNNDRRSEKVS